MRIAMVGHKRIPSHEGGIEVVVEALATRMAGLGHQVTCYNRKGHHVSGKQFDTEEVPVYKGVRLVYVPTLDRRGFAAVTSSFFGTLFAALGPYDVVHVHAEGPAVFCWLPRLFGKRVVVTIHGLDWARDKWKGGFGSRYIHAGEKMAVRFANQIIVLNRGTQRYFEETYGRKTVYLPNGVDHASYAAPNIIREKYGLEKDSYILFLGRIVPEKGCHFLCEAFRQIKTDKKLVIAGGSSDTWGYLHDMQRDYGDDKRIIFTGFVDGEERRELYSNPCVFVLPSLLEGMPMSLLEAMSYGNCVLTSDIEECVSVTGENGLRFRKGDVQDLKSQLEYLLTHPGVVKEFQKRASEFVWENYQWDRIAEQTLELYKRDR